MKDLLKTLLDLQSVDSSLRKVEEELAELPRELSSRDGELQARKKDVEDNRQAIKDCQVKIHSIEGEIKTREERITKCDQESNSVRDNAQLFAIQHQIKSLREEIGKFEDEALGLYAEVEKLQEKGKDLDEQVKKGEEEHKRFQKSVKEEIAVREEEKQKLLAQREAFIPEIKAELFEKYTRILNARDGLAMAAVEDEICRGCNMEVLPNDYVKLVKCREMVYCRHCNRILYLPAEEKTE